MIPDIVISPTASAVIVALAGVIGYLFKLLWDSRTREMAHIAEQTEREIESLETQHKRQVATLEEQRDSYMKMAARATWAVEAAANRERARSGLPPFEALAPVVPEHNSPTTTAQQHEADFHTMQAQVVAAAKILDVDLAKAPDPISDIAVIGPVAITEATVSGIIDGEKRVVRGVTVIGQMSTTLIPHDLNSDQNPYPFPSSSPKT